MGANTIRAIKIAVKDCNKLPLKISLATKKVLMEIATVIP
jgi:hypothetical protein